MARKNTENGLILARENRIFIKDIKEDIKCIKIDIDKLTNHYSKRLPVWATVLITILGSLTTGLIVAFVGM